MVVLNFECFKMWNYFGKKKIFIDGFFICWILVNYDIIYVLKCLFLVIKKCKNGVKF